VTAVALRLARSPWVAVVLAGAALAFAVAYAPDRTAFAVPFAASLGFLAWRFGLRRGVWYLFVISIPLRQPLGVDVLGTRTLFYSDLLLYAQFGTVLWERSLRELWRGSDTFRLGTPIFAISVVGLYWATHLDGGIAHTLRVFDQILVLLLARHLVRTGAEARRTLVAMLVGILPAVAYAFYQTTIPVGAENYPDWAELPLAFDASGRAFVRIFSTFDNPLPFSHALTTCFGIALGFLFSRVRGLHRFLALLVAVLVGYCNQFTYSLGGAVAMVVTLLFALGWFLGKRAIVVAPLVVGLLFVVTPNAVYLKASKVLEGDSTSSLSRIITYQRTLRILADRPLTGLGWGGIKETVTHDYRVSRASSVGVAAENYFLQRALALGLPGMLLYLLIAIRFFRNLRAPDGPPDAPPGERWPRRALIVGGVAYYTQAMLYPTGGVSMGYTLWLLLALAEGMAADARDGGGS